MIRRVEVVCIYIECFYNYKNNNWKSQATLDVFDVVQEPSRKRASQSVLYNDLIAAEVKRILALSNSRANDPRSPNDYARVRYRNWASSINSDLGAWLSTSGSPKLCDAQQRVVC